MMFKNIFNNKKEYRLPLGYIENLNPSYSIDSLSDNITYKPYIYELALYFANRANISNIIFVGSVNISKLTQFLENGYEVYCIDKKENISIIKEKLSKYMNITYIECNLSKYFPDIERVILQNSIIVAADVVEHIVEVDNFLQWLSKVSYYSKYLLVSTPDRDRVRGYGDLGVSANLTHAREWNANEFKLLLNDYKFNYNLLGHTINTNHHQSKLDIMVISGREIAYSINQKDLKSILAIINVYNERDIVVETIEHLLKQGVDVYIYDDNSTDGSYEIIKQKYNNSKHVFIEQRKEKSQDYEWEELLKHTEVITEKFEYDWFMHCDADEIRYSPWKGVTIQEAVSFIDKLGYDSIDFTVLDFRFLSKNDTIEFDYEDNILSFEFGKRPGHFSQIKLWKKQDTKVDLHSSGGHEVIFKNRKVYPVKFLLKHYPLRNKQQMVTKVFQDRKQRVEKEQNKKGWHTQYNLILKEGISDKLPWQNNQLIYWNNHICYDEFLVELISGIGNI